MNKFFVIGLLCILICKVLPGQEVPVKTQQQLENLADVTENEAPADDSYLQQLDYFIKHPINLNSATVSDLQSLILLTDLQINNLIRYRNVLGKFVDLYELQAVPTLDITTIKKLLPYITLSEAVDIKENFLSRFKDGEKNILFRISRVLEKSKGYNKQLNNYYLGDRNHLLLRYRYQYKDLLQYGVVADKDAGEQFFKGVQAKGFDFYSIHFFVRRLGKIKALAIGDYTVNLGQGLIQWQSLAFGKSAEVMAIKRQSPVLLPYRSAGEFNFNRGVGVTLKLNKIEATAFVSLKKFSGNIIDSVNAFSSFLLSGYYRSISEIRYKNSVGDFSTGGNINYQTSDLKIGVNIVSHQFSKPLQKRDEPYNQFAFAGKNLWNASIDYSYTYKNVHFFGEAAVDKNFNKALLSGALLSVDPKVDISVLYRNMSMKYQTVFGNAFTKNTLPANEKGIYLGVLIRPSATWQLSAYADFFSFPWIKYRMDAPGAGTNYLFQIEHQPDKQTQVYALFRTKTTPVNESAGVTNYLLQKTRQNLRIHFTKEINSSIVIKSRVEMLWYNKKESDAEEGFLGYVEGSHTFKKIQSILRLQYFETNGYNSRIYAYESDVLYSYSIPSFFDKGLRYYYNFKYDLNKKISLWLRWAQTIYHNKKTIGSGLDEINGTHKSEIKFQLLMGL